MGLQYINQPQIFQSLASFERGLSGTSVRASSVSAVSVSGINVIGNYFGAANTFNLSSTTIQSLVTSTSGSVFSGTFLGDGTRLAVTYLPQQREINTFVVQNTATMKVQVLTAQRVHADYFGNTIFPVTSSILITNAVTLSQAVFNGIFYGDGRNLLGVIPEQSAINLITQSISATPVFETLEVKKSGTTTLLASSGFVGVNTNQPNEAVTVVGNVSATGYVYGDGLYLTNITTGNRRFDYVVSGDINYTYSGTTASSTTTTNQSAWKIVKIEYAPDGAVTGLSGVINAAWVERYQPWVVYT